MTRSQVRPNLDPPRPVRLGRYRYSRLRWRISVRAFDLIGSLVMFLWRFVRSPRVVNDPRQILLIQLDHLGDAVLTSPLLAQLRSAFPDATIDVLASNSNFEVFSADPNVNRVHLAERSWFERRRGHWAMLSAVWSIGASLRGKGYDIGIDVRGDILTVLVMALAGIPRRVGWAMGGGGFLLTDVAEWVPGRHEVRSRLALLTKMGVPIDGPARVVVHVDDSDRVLISYRLHEAWPKQFASPNGSILRTHSSRPTRSRIKALAQAELVLTTETGWDEPDWLHAGRFGGTAPILAAHLGAGTAAKRWPPSHWRDLIARFIADGWRVVVVGGQDDVEVAAALDPHPNLQDWTGCLSVPGTVALLERADLFIGADSGPSHLAASAGILSVILFSGTNRAAQWRPWSRRALVLRHHVPCRPCHQKVCPLSDHLCMSGLEPERVYRSATRWWARLHRQESPHAPL